MRSFRAALVAAALLAIISQPARADTSGLLRGTVTLDEKPAAGVALTLRGEGTTATTESNAKGEFVFTRVAFGRYALTAHKAGVDDVTHQIELLSGSVSAVNLDLHTLHEIAHTQSGLTRGVASSPVAVNTLGRAQISTLPNNQSLDSLVATMPGIVRFSYNEPIAHGFHGVTYEIDGVPLPQGTASNFGEIIDPRTIDSFEVFTGAFPAEYGGSRQGAIVNIVSHRATDVTAPEAGYVSFGGGNYGSAQTSIGEALAISSNTRLFINTNSERTDRGLDSPTFDPQHDASSNTNQFLRTITNITKHDTLALDLSNNYATFQVPINTVTTPIAPVAVPRGTDDVQREYDQFANLVYTHTSADENSYTLVAPWYRYDRVVYAGDLPSDLQGTFTDFSQDPPAVTPLDGLRQDRSSEFTGLRLAHFHVFGPNAVKAGIDTSVENFVGTSQLAYYDSSGVQQNFFDNAAQKGSLFSAYVQDKWTPNHYISVFGGCVSTTRRATRPALS
ncbi:MAG TPA: carboxypeptidase regulatory-like domain-containing protein [Candidatus Baltobacteraceae bacterium]|nr:carboxypeptidase regulatory-like domain-containing protein [Candidatus Baltobacteraceae bacterium]